MRIRKANKNDFEAIDQLVKEAFKTAKVSDGTEQDFVLKLRNGENYIEQLEFVAEDNGNLIGHILFTKIKAKLEQGELLGLLVAPLCVKLEYRNQKIGAKLMEYGFEKAKKLGYTVAFLTGNPQYYQRFGFKQTNLYGIKNESDVPDQFVLACEIVPDALKQVKGSIKIGE